MSFGTRYTLTATIAISAASMAEAVQTADAIYDEAAEYGHVHVHIEEPPGDTPDPEGVFCEGCDGHTIPGVRWPTATNGDTSHEWVERCDTCQRFPDDDAAAARVVETYAGAAEVRVEEAVPVGLESTYLYIAGEVSGIDP